jgi:predicted RND superfamily exporter protein
MILLLFRAIRWVVLPLVVVHVTLIWTKAVLVLTGIESSMVSTMLTSLLTIIGLATVMHVTVLYRERRKTRDRFDAFRETLIVLGPPTFWTCVTTAIGFGALLSSQISPVRSFALMMAVGTMFVLVTSIVILPGGALLGRFGADPRHTPAEQKLLSGLSRISHTIDRRPRLWLAAMLCLMAATGAGLFRLRVETDFSRNFRESTPIVQSLQFFEHHLGGAGTWEVNFPAPEELNDDSLEPVRGLTAALREIELADGTQLTKVISITDGIDFAPGGNVDQKLDRLALIQPEFAGSLYNPETGMMRIMLRSREQQPAEVKLQLIDEVTRVSREYYPRARATGLYVLLANLVSSLLEDQLVSFGLAALGVFLCMSIAFRSLRVGLISMLPNVFPLLLVIGGMGWTGLPINLGTAMIASVSMGLTVDSSIHYISGYLRARDAGASHREAVRSTHGSVGRTLVFAYLVLVFGFLVLTLSNFIPLVYFGALVSLSMVGGLLGDLVLLPLLLKYVPVRGAINESMLAPETARAGLIPASHAG